VARSGVRTCAGVGARCAGPGGALSYDEGLRSCVAAMPVNPSAPSASRPATPNPAAADDGDALHFCSTCAFSDACMSQGYDKTALGELHVLVDHVGRSRPATTCSVPAIRSIRSPRCAPAWSRPLSMTARATSRCWVSACRAR
jgi:hypothetical protein